jgi:hypothetical protein
MAILTKGVIIMFNTNKIYYNKQNNQYTCTCSLPSEELAAILSKKCAMHAHQQFGLPPVVNIYQNKSCIIVESLSKILTTEIAYSLNKYLLILSAKDLQK